MLSDNNLHSSQGDGLPPANGNAIDLDIPEEQTGENSTTTNATSSSGRSGEVEKLRTFGALFAIYWICRLVVKDAWVHKLLLSFCRIAATSVMHLACFFVSVVFASPRATRTPISEPRFSTSCDMRFSPRDIGLVDFLFFCSGEGRESPRRQDDFQLKIPGGGGVLPGGWGRGGEGPGGCLQGIWGGGAKYFFRGPKLPRDIGKTAIFRRFACKIFPAG